MLLSVIHSAKCQRQRTHSAITLLERKDIWDLEEKGKKCFNCFYHIYVKKAKARNFSCHLNPFDCKRDWKKAV